MWILKILSIFDENKRIWAPRNKYVLTIGCVFEYCCVKVSALIGVAMRPYLAILWEFEDH